MTPRPQGVERLRLGPQQIEEVLRAHGPRIIDSDAHKRQAREPAEPTLDLVALGGLLAVVAH